MQASLRALLTGVIDYAGMFPPASLPLEQSIRNYLYYRTEPEGWMLGRFICPAGRLAELAPFLADVDHARPLGLSVLGSPASTRQELVENLRWDQLAIRSFRDEHPGQIAVEALEVKLPPDFPRESQGVADLVSAGMVTDPDSATDPMFVFESSFPPASAEMTALIAGLAGVRQRVTMKLRCGGAAPGAYPTPGEVASVIAGCHRAKVPLKFTAGLHHPIRHFNAAAGVTMHGFVNVFCAALLNWAYDLDAEAGKRELIEAIIADKDDGHFVFADDSIRWKDHHLTARPEVLAGTLAMFRRQVVSFGSCSFDEPRDDLRKLGWLP